MVKILKVAIVTSLLFISGQVVNAYASNVYEHFPTQINADEKYVFYSHGLIVEGKNPTPTHPRWGVYEFPKVKTALTSEHYNLIAYHRALDTKPRDFAKKLASDVDLLIKKGVKAENISLVGFSRGGEITILASSYINSSAVNIVLLAACSSFMKGHAEFTVVGNFHSIYETSDGNGSCQFLVDQSDQINTMKEISISTGKEHGAFYQALPEWIVPVKNWLALAGAK
ncbi:alpha/beta hydrolase [Colwellia sp. 75C3]|uniref:alpha/beta hydrolase n=1 Tax=Colwellia sp. 75C3 TaxID=888425 RepID=UPI000C331A6A|nr:alpha/beta hydrolase [Colwellia sp. 75C3]PKG81393.1 alpha/beta hydrolase [Colwellia sp. 75C3]